MKIYHEDDWIAEVEVVKDLSDKEWIKFELKVIRTIRKSKIFKPVPDGTIFECSVKRKYPNMGGWSLRDDEEVLTR